MTTIIGDVHGDFYSLSRIMKKTNGDVLCVGDVGIGFSETTPCLSKRFFFIRGNHDNPYLCKKHPQFAADYGMWRDIFVIGGARSVDKEWRTENINWWRDEELSCTECQEALKFYSEIKPRVVVSHEVPFSLQPEIKEAVVKKDPRLAAYGEPKPYATSMIMDEMLLVHQPELWVSGHWHHSWQKDLNGTRFRVLDILEVICLKKELLKLSSNNQINTGILETGNGKTNKQTKTDINGKC